MDNVPLNDTIDIDLPSLIDTRLLVQANSGGGKSWLLRRLLEQSHGKIQQIVIDLEGEFSTLREKYDYILAAKEGDTPADPRSAGLLASRLLELHVSAIIDLYELSHQERKSFVRLFLTAMINAPKALWHPCLVIIDEAHVFAPQAGQSEAMEAVIDLATRGRKRGYCLPPDERVITSDGLKPICKVSTGDLVLTHTGRFKSVIKTYKRFYEGDLVRTKSWNNCLSTLTTPEHPFAAHLTHNNGAGTKVKKELEWVAAEKLVVGESRDTTRVFSPVLLENVKLKTLNISYEPRSRSPLTKRGTARRKLKHFELPVTNALMRVIGWYLAEGSVSKRQHQVGKYYDKVVFTLGTHEKTEIATLQADLTLLGLKSHLVHVGPATRVVVASRGFAELLSHKFGCYSDKKHIPMSIQKFPPHLLKHMLKTYIDGDGWINPKKKSFVARTTTVSFKLAVALRMVGEKVGYFSGISQREERVTTIQGRVYDCKKAYINSFSENPRTAKRLADGRACYSVSSKELVPYKGFVYDLAVQDDHSFCTPAHVIHNCAILATQRLSKLHKDAVAECNNKLIGRTGLDIDRKRAAEELGFTTKEDALSLRNLAPGEFYAFGPALSKAVEKVTIGPVETSHPKAGARISTQVTPPTDRIRKFIAQLADLPKEAKQEIENMETLRIENAALRRRITQLEKQCLVEQPKVVTIEKTVCGHDKVLRQIQSIISKELEPTTRMPDIHASAPPTAKKPIIGGALRMLRVLASHYPMTFTRSQLALMANMSPKSGTYGNYLSLLRSRNLIEAGTEVSITEGGLAYVGTEKPEPQTQEEILNMWRNNLIGGARRMFDVLVSAYPQSIERAELGALTEMSSSSGTFGNYLSLLRRNGLVDVTGTSIKASANLFLPIKVKL